MPVPLTYPGVYVQEVPSGVRTIAGVSTSTALFIGDCADGPMNMPTLCLSYSDFARQFSEDTTRSDMARYVKLFYLNGGTTCYVMRIASGAQFASATLRDETKADSLKLTATNPGLAGNTTRFAVTYDTDQPEATFNLEIFRWGKDSGGNPVKTASELWRNLSMNPTSPLYAEAFLNANSALVTAVDLKSKPVSDGYSQAGRPIDYQSFADLSAVLSTSSCKFQMTVGSNPPVTVDMTPLITSVPSDSTTFIADLKPIINAALSNLPNPVPVVTPSFELAPPALIGTPDKSGWLRLTATGADVFVSPSPSNDIAVPLMLGTAQSGLEVGAWTANRPAPTGMTIPPAQIVGNGASVFAAQKASTIASTTVDGALINILPSLGDATHAMYIDSLGNHDGIREKLRKIQQVVADYAAANPSFGWTADVSGYRLTLRNANGGDNDSGTLSFAVWAPTVDTSVRYYQLGSLGTGNYQTPGTDGTDGVVPTPPDYTKAYPVVDREVDLFNLMVLPSATGVDQKQLWGAASVFCQQRRAFLIMDAPQWADAQTAQSQVDNLRIGLVKDYSAVYFPRLTITENNLPVNLGASGAMAGIYARTDAARGVWKAPAGLEADLRGISGLEKRFSDLENGVMNPKAINTLRIFPDGVVSWGARTNAGSDANPNDWKYIPIRRLALYMEESLYRGLKWVVFEPNDEPLWAQIRLNVGAFMHDLFRQGAFQGQTPKDAYFVRCDKETTTQDDRNKGIVNIWVGFAPLKPAEFVVLYLQQMAGQIEV